MTKQKLTFMLLFVFKIFSYFLKLEITLFPQTLIHSLPLISLQLMTSFSLVVVTHIQTCTYTYAHIHISTYNFHFNIYSLFTKSLIKLGQRVNSLNWELSLIFLIAL